MLGFLVIIIGVALLFQYNLKLNRLAEAKSKENITVLSDNNSLNEQNLNEAVTDNNPITLWVQTFPFNQTLTRSNSLPAPLFQEKTAQRHTSLDRKKDTPRGPVVLLGKELEEGSIMGRSRDSTSSGNTTNMKQ